MNSVKHNEIIVCCIMVLACILIGARIGNAQGDWCMYDPSYCTTPEATIEPTPTTQMECYGGWLGPYGCEWGTPTPEATYDPCAAYGMCWYETPTPENTPDYCMMYGMGCLETATPWADPTPDGSPTPTWCAQYAAGLVPYDEMRAWAEGCPFAQMPTETPRPTPTATPEPTVTPTPTEYVAPYRTSTSTATALPTATPTSNALDVTEAGWEMGQECAQLVANLVANANFTPVEVSGDNPLATTVTLVKLGGWNARLLEAPALCLGLFLSASAAMTCDWAISTVGVIGKAQACSPAPSRLAWEPLKQRVVAMGMYACAAVGRAFVMAAPDDGTLLCELEPTPDPYATIIVPVVGAGATPTATPTYQPQDPDHLTPIGPPPTVLTEPLTPVTVGPTPFPPTRTPTPTATATEPYPTPGQIPEETPDYYCYYYGYCGTATPDADPTPEPEPTVTPDMTWSSTAPPPCEATAYGWPYDGLYGWCLGQTVDLTPATTWQPWYDAAGTHTPYEWGVVGNCFRVDQEQKPNPGFNFSAVLYDAAYVTPVEWRCYDAYDAFRPIVVGTFDSRYVGSITASQTQLGAELLLDGLASGAGADNFTSPALTGVPPILPAITAVGGAALNYLGSISTNGSLPWNIWTNPMRHYLIGLVGRIMSCTTVEQLWQTLWIMRGEAVVEQQVNPAAGEAHVKMIEAMIAGLTAFAR